MQEKCRVESGRPRHREERPSVDRRVFIAHDPTAQCLPRRAYSRTHQYFGALEEGKETPAVLLGRGRRESRLLTPF